MILRSLCLFCLIFCASVDGKGRLPQLPASLPIDESEAAAQLADGSLDSSFWALVEPFYSQPLRVLHGELAILRELFPELSARIPARSERLRGYEPWGPSDIERFFSDFPVLQSFRPILDFQASALPHVARLGLTLHSSYPDGSARQLLQLSTADGSLVALDLRADVSERYARWRRRTIRFEPKANVRILLGNSGFVPDALTYGLYPLSTQMHADIETNWAYGAAAAWNGLVAQLGPSAHVSESLPTVHVFAHARPSEQIIGSNASFQPTGLLGVSAGASRLLARESNELSPDTFYYCTAGLSARSKTWSARLGTSIDVISRTMPVMAAIGFESGPTTGSLEMYAFPKQFNGPRSALLDRYFGDAARVDTAFSVIETRIDQRVSPEITIRQGFSGVMHNVQVRQVAGDISVHLTKPERIRLGYRYSNTDLDSDNSVGHELSAAGSFVASAFSVRASDHLAFRSNDILLYGEIEPVWHPGKAITVGPQLRYRLSKGDWSYYAGLRQRMELFSKTSTEIMIGRPISPSEMEGFNVQVRSWFYF